MRKHITYKFIMHGWLIVLCAVFLPSAAFAQAKLTASASSTTVGLNTAFSVTYSLSGGQGESFTRPSFANFSVTGSSRTSGGGMQIWVNGQLVQGGDGEESWTFTLVPKATGKFTIDAARVKVGGQWITSNTLTIEVAQTAPAQSQQQKQGQTQKSAAADTDSEVFLKAFVSKTNPMMGEQVVLTYKIYTRIPVTQYSITKLASLSGFWTHDLMKDRKAPHQYMETINGVKYTVAEIRKVAMFPQKSGTLTIEPQEVECVVQVQVRGGSAFDRFFNDPFFQQSFGMQNVKRTLKSNSLTLHVSPLPAANKPADFSGAVGEFSFRELIDQTDVKQNEPITVKYTVSGTGNLSLIDKLPVQFPSDFEVYDPQINENISTAGDRISGSRTFEYLVIPRTAGTFNIKPVVFSYFDLKQRAYITHSSPEYTIKVAKGEGGTPSVFGGGSKEDIQYIGSDIRYLNMNILPLQASGRYFITSPWFYILLALPALLFILFVIIWRRRLKLYSNAALLKNVRATGVAKKRLKTAGTHLRAGDREKFYMEISRALWGYTSDKFAIPPAGLSLETVRETLSGRGMPAELLDHLVDTLNKCEYARFAPADPSLAMDRIFEGAAEYIRQVEELVRNNKQA